MELMYKFEQSGVDLLWGRGRGGGRLETLLLLLG